MKTARWILALAICAMAGACADKPQAPPAEPDTSNADAWEPGMDIAGTQVVIDGEAQEIPADAAATKRKMDEVAAGYTKEMDELERKRQKNFSGDADLQP